MKLNYEILSKVPLFRGMSEELLSELLVCLDSDVKNYDKNAIIFREGDTPSKIGIVLNGGVLLFKEDYYGNRAVLETASATDMFLESFACAGVSSLPLNVVATEKSAVMLINFEKIKSPCVKSCGVHNRLVQNLLHIVALKNLSLNKKIEFTSKKTTKEKLISYLTSASKEAGSDTFTIPFDRQTLADYLGVDRSAMSAEIGKLRDAGKIEVCRRKFKIIKDKSDPV